MGYRAGTEVPDQSLTQVKMAAAATFTPQADSFTFEHNNKSAILVTLPILIPIRYASDATTGIAPGSVVGQTLLIVLLHNGYTNWFTLTNGGNVSIAGDWKAAANQSAILLIWDGEKWLELGRWVNVAASDASGKNALAFGGGATASGDNSVSVGGFGTASGEGSAVLGAKGTASGSYSAAVGGFWTNASGWYSTVFGNGAQARYTGSIAQASGSFAASLGQYASYVVGAGVSHSTSNWYSLAFADSSKLLVLDGQMLLFDAFISGHMTDGTGAMAFQIRGQIKNSGGTTTLVWSNVETLHKDIATFDAQAVADDVNDALLVQVKDTAAGSDGVLWTAHVRVVETNI